MPTDLFVGLVTHAGSRFADAATDEGLGATVVRTFKQQGREAIWSISAADLWSPETLPIDRSEVARSIDAEMDLEGRWRSYLRGRGLALPARLLLAARRLRRRTTLLPASGRELRPDDPGFRSARRLANIELSHLSVMREAVDSGAEWVLILEDDAWAPDAPVFAMQMADFIDAHTDVPRPVMVSLSESFTPAQLGIELLLSPLSQNDSQRMGHQGGIPWSLWQAERPVTNTVCATLYRRDFLVRLVETLDAIPLSPVVPIDFKLNEALMRLAPTMQPGVCWIAHPAPLDQRSGVPQVRG